MVFLLSLNHSSTFNISFLLFPRIFPFIPQPTPVFPTTLLLPPYFHRPTSSFTLLSPHLCYPLILHLTLTASHFSLILLSPGLLLPPPQGNPHQTLPSCLKLHITLSSSPSLFSPQLSLSFIIHSVISSHSPHPFRLIRPPLTPSHPSSSSPRPSVIIPFKQRDPVMLP